MAFGMSLAWYLVVSLYSPFSVRYRFEKESSRTVKVFPLAVRWFSQMLARKGPTWFRQSGVLGMSTSGILCWLFCMVFHLCFFSSRFFVPLDECFGRVEHGLAACSAVRGCFFSGSWWS